VATVIRWKDKHGDVVYDANNAEQFTGAVLSIIQQRLDEGYLDYPDDAEERAQAILDASDGKEGWKFLQERNGHEYEYVEQVLTARKTVVDRRF